MLSICAHIWKKKKFGKICKNFLNLKKWSGVSICGHIPVEGTGSDMGCDHKMNFKKNENFEFEKFSCEISLKFTNFPWESPPMENKMRF